MCLDAVELDDELLDRITSGDDYQDGLSRLLVWWRREIHAVPVGELVSTDEALAVIATSKR